MYTASHKCCFGIISVTKTVAYTDTECYDILKRSSYFAAFYIIVEIYSHKVIAKFTLNVFSSIVIFRGCNNSCRDTSCYFFSMRRT